MSHKQNDIVQEDQMKNSEYIFICGDIDCDGSLDPVSDEPFNTVGASTDKNGIPEVWIEVRCDQCNSRWTVFTTYKSRVKENDL